MAREKPQKPYDGFPLYAHATGQWAKKIRGKVYYFGPWDDWRKALEKYVRERDDLQAGRTPRTEPDGLTIKGLGDRFLTEKIRLAESGELAKRTYYDYHATCQRLADFFGKDRAVLSLTTLDFSDLRLHLAKSRKAAVALGNEIQRVRSVFKFAFDAGLIDVQVRFGPAFRRPNQKTLRTERFAKGPRMFEADELHRIIGKAGVHFQAMILIGLNCGFGPSDISNLPLSALDLETGWVTFPRPKTAVPRRCPLWPETIAVLRLSLAARPAPKRSSDAGLVFLTRFGQRWVKTNKNGTPDDSIGKEFTKLLNKHKLKRPGIGFYALRHTTETIGSGAKDQIALDHIMGHSRVDMASIYREWVADDRLLSVSNLIRRWLFPAG